MHRKTALCENAAENKNFLDKKLVYDKINKAMTKRAEAWYCREGPEGARSCTYVGSHFRAFPGNRDAGLRYGR